MMKIILLLVLLFTLSGCAQMIMYYDSRNKDPSCSSTCDNTYYKCIPGDSSHATNNDKHNACRETYEKCISSCDNE